ncbi:MAG: hypothetical protein A2W08_17595 [Candidatus Rokubacteria bacterium RBG_16_73_20]|nr:MAG: hypothetical protein A2W08_17595 [Candidatus Rokubacteria bacterium RBG_16_73_20]HBH03387.1 hypothetical protein [Candidatus Rokubacteria bacterium]
MYILYNFYRAPISSTSARRRFREHFEVSSCFRSRLIVTCGVASVAVVVDAKDDNVVSCSRRYGSITFQDQPNKLFLPMAVVEQLCG